MCSSPARKSSLVAKPCQNDTSFTRAVNLENTVLRRTLRSRQSRLLCLRRTAKQRRKKQKTIGLSCHDSILLWGLIKIAKKHASINECLPINKCKTYTHTKSQTSSCFYSNFSIVQRLHLMNLMLTDDAPNKCKIHFISFSNSSCSLYEKMHFDENTWSGLSKLQIDLRPPQNFNS